MCAGSRKLRRDHEQNGQDAFLLWVRSVILLMPGVLWFNGPRVVKHTHGYCTTAVAASFA